MGHCHVQALIFQSKCGPTGFPVPPTGFLNVHISYLHEDNLFIHSCMSNNLAASYTSATVGHAVDTEVRKDPSTCSRPLPAASQQRRPGQRLPWRPTPCPGSRFWLSLRTKSASLVHDTQRITRWCPTYQSAQATRTKSADQRA